MTERGSCAVCGKDVAVSSGDRIRGHLDRRLPWPSVRCAGSGMPNPCVCRECVARRASTERPSEAPSPAPLTDRGQAPSSS